MTSPIKDGHLYGVVEYYLSQAYCVCVGKMNRVKIQLKEIQRMCMC